MGNPSFSVNHCGVCGERKLVYGDARARLCRRCWSATLAWVQISECGRWLLALAFERAKSVVAALNR